MYSFHTSSVTFPLEAEQLEQRYVPDALRNNDPAMMSMLLDEGARRKGKIGQTIREASEKIAMPDFDKAQEHLDHIEKSARALQSASHRLQTGELDVEAKAAAAAKRIRDDES